MAGDEYGTEETAKEFGVQHVPDVEVNEYGTPLENSVMRLAEEIAENELMCTVASDVIFLNDLLPAVDLIAKSMNQFAMVSQRWNLNVPQPINFDSSWEKSLESQLATNGRLYVHSGMDYLVYPKGIFGEVPPFAVGRRAYDNWILFTLRSKGINVVDASKVVKIIHQDHDYSHHPDGQMGIMYGIEAQRNVELAGNRAQRFILKDRTHILNKNGIRRSRDLWWLWRALRTAEALHPDMPLPARLCVKAINSIITLTGRLHVFALRTLKIPQAHERTRAG